MIIPGFTAEASVYRTTQSYRATTDGSLGLTASSITPQLDCSSKCTAEYTACLAGCLFAGGPAYPDVFSHLVYVKTVAAAVAAGAVAAGAAPGRIRVAGVRRGPCAKADASRSQAWALSATGIVLAPAD